MHARTLKILAGGAFVAASLLSGPAAAQPMPPRPALEIHFASTAPPRPQIERRGHRPDRDSVWVAGAWDWRGDQWAWLPGRWDRPEVRGTRWIAPLYVRDGGGYRYHPGHWATERVVEGADYREWHERHHNDRSHDRKWDRDRDRHDDRDHGHDRG